MSTLDEVLIEEYDRCERIKHMYLGKLNLLNNEERQKYQNSIEEVEFDQKKLLAYFDVAGIDINAYRIEE